jgi:hypothetical protein
MRRYISAAMNKSADPESVNRLDSYNFSENSYDAEVVDQLSL